MGIAGFTDFDLAGQPYMGLIVEDGGIIVKFYLAHKINAQSAADELCKQIQKMASDLRKVEPKLIEAPGGIDGIRRA